MHAGLNPTEERLVRRLRWTISGRAQRDVNSVLLINILDWSVVLVFASRGTGLLLGLCSCSGRSDFKWLMVNLRCVLCLLSFKSELDPGISVEGTLSIRDMSTNVVGIA